MRYIYLMRHANPGYAEDPRRCLGNTDVCISDYGEKKIKQSREFIHRFDWKKVYTSPMKRCIQTGECLGIKKDEMEIRRNLREMEAGIWENLTFTEIKERYPELYEARGQQIGTFAVEGAESFEQAGERFEKCIDAIRKETEKDMLVIAHAGVIRAFLCRMTGQSADKVLEYSIPYGSITVIEEEKGELRLIESGICSADLLDEDEIKRIYRKCKTPENVISHMKKVCDVLEHLMEKKDSKMKHLSREDRSLLKKAALLHDIFRTEKKHAQRAADFLRKEGYKELAEIVGLHHSDNYNNSMDVIENHEILFYADKLVQGDKIVSVEERFAQSYVKCKGIPEAEQKHKRLYQKALLIEKKISGL